MEGRGIKRKHYEMVKDTLAAQLHKLTIDSGNYNSDVIAANEDFEQMCKAIADQQADFLSRSLILEEQYGVVDSVLDGGDVSVGDSSGETSVLPRGYTQDVSKLVVDGKTSLEGHTQILFDEYEQMQKIFCKYEKVWSENMKDMIRRAEENEKRKPKFVQSYLSLADASLIQTKAMKIVKTLKKLKNNGA